MKVKGVSSPGSQPIPDDPELVGRIRLGDQDAMAILYDRYSKVVYSVALRVLGDPGAAEDVMQEVLLQLWRNPRAFNSSRGSMAAWLAVITRHRAIDELRRRRPHLDLEETVISVEPDLAGEAARAEAMERVRGVLEELEDEQRTTLELALFEGLTHSEIALRTGDPLGTVKTRIRSALMAIRKAFSS